MPERFNKAQMRNELELVLGTINQRLTAGRSRPGFPIPLPLTMLQSMSRRFLGVAPGSAKHFIRTWASMPDRMCGKQILRSRSHGFGLGEFLVRRSTFNECCTPTCETKNAKDSMWPCTSWSRRDQRFTCTPLAVRFDHFGSSTASGVRRAHAEKYQNGADV